MADGDDCGEEGLRVNAICRRGPGYQARPRAGHARPSIDAARRRAALRKNRSERMRHVWLLLPLALGLAAPAAAQHAHDPAHAVGGEIKALTPQQVSEYLDGAGMGLALAAELNHYPGPLHVLELAEQLRLGPDQLARVRASRGHVVSRATALGRAIVDLERQLDHAFASGNADTATVTRLTAEIARLQGELRAAHLNAHVETRAALTPDQIKTYDRLRGH
jgi:Spy/CpxP family protein refolding chaperone